ncbi:MAG TPA: ABC transporter ATP-binding protein, partial [Ktedonobacteraceae bacterium]|nr:ABC transporter ATP-binding protein [Ktedonobacteraceae bacterium]
MTIDPSNQTDTPIAPAISVRGLSFRYRSVEDDEPGAAATSKAQAQKGAIENISFELPAGELMLIAGPSGCGKSTLLKCLNGLIPHSYKGFMRGEIRLEGCPTKGLSLRELARLVGTMLQDPDKQILGNTVEQEVAFGMENLGVQRPRMLQRIAEVLSEMHLERFQHQATHTLSGGQRQQVAACGLLVMEPGIFLFDEPFANLDSRAVEELENLIERLRGQGRTVVIVEHRVEEALHLNPNKVLLMREGRQVFFGDTAAFLEVADPTQVKLPIAATLRTLDPQTTVGDLLVRPIITGGGTPDAKEQPVLAFENVEYRYKSAS